MQKVLSSLCYYVTVIIAISVPFVSDIPQGYLVTS